MSVFVENRIKEIKLEKDVTFCYIATDCNPSDCATRGLSVKEMCSLLYGGMDHLGFEMLMYCSQMEFSQILLLKFYNK